ncbi:MAG TPA: pyridoxamine 5'-phosphate oxidase family protein [Nevskiaceae bacterium]|nr:pyridoxamine 5'-phosphate oxidase family protein [Nevskiaceae bacterium]
MIPGWTLAESPFHRGEKTVHDRLGIHARIEAQVRRAGIRTYMPDQHREFFTFLPMLLIGRLDAAGQPWATLRVGNPGFVSSPDAQHLRISGLSLAGDPVGAFRVGDSIATLGIQLHTGRRNRANGIVTAVDSDAVTLEVHQSFGNCNKYIQSRLPEWRTRRERRPLRVTEAKTLSAVDRALLARSDTFFIASAYLGEDAGAARGVDVSHKGGWPGFVRLDDARNFTVPDFIGNSYFNTLGNLILNPLAGLLFIDFATGDVLYVAARAEILWNDPQATAVRGAQRLVRFHVTRVRRTAAALPFTWSEPEYSAALRNTGIWQAPKAAGDAPAYVAA